MQALDLQQKQVAGDDDRRLDLAQQEKHDVPAEVQLIGLGGDQPVQPGVGLDDGHQNDAAHPNGQHRIEGGHGGAVVLDGIDGGDGGLHHLGEVLAVLLRVAAQDLQQEIQIFAVGETLQLVDQIGYRLGQPLGGGPQQRHGLVQRQRRVGQRIADGLSIIGQLLHIAHGGGDLAHDIVQILPQIVGGGQQLAGQVADGGDDVPAVLDGGLQIVIVRQGGQTALQGVASVGDVAGDPGGQMAGGLLLQPIGPGGELVAHLTHGGGCLLNGLAGLLKLTVIHGGLLDLVQGPLHLLQGGVDGSVDLGHGLQNLVAVRQLAVDVLDDLCQLARVDVHGAVVPGGVKGVHGGPAAGQQILHLIEQTLYRRLGIVRRQVGGQQVGLGHHPADDHLQIVLADGALQALHRGVGDLGGHGVLLGVFIVGDGGLAGPLRQHVVHLIGEILVDDHRGVVIPGVYAVLGLLFAVHHDPVDAGGLPQVVDHVVTLVDVHAVLVGVALVQRGQGDGDPAGVAVGIPVGIDVQPCVQAGQHGDGHHHRAGKEAFAQRFDVSFEYRPDIAHSPS